MPFSDPDHRNLNYRREEGSIGFIILLLILSIPLFTYRFNHPEKTETELFLGTFEAYAEFFQRKSDG